MLRLFLLVGGLLCLLASPALARTIDVSDNHGGSVVKYDARWTELAHEGVSVRIVGPCQSACTDLLGHIPASRICVTAQASFGFHLAGNENATSILWNSYSPGVQAWINARGGLKHDFMWMSAPDTYKFFKRC